MLFMNNARGMIARSLNARLFKMRIQAAHKNLFSVPYENFFEENKLFLDEISDELGRAMSIRNSQDSQLYVQGFAQQYGSHFGSSYAIAVSSGTEALSLSLIALGIGQGDEVITTCHSYAATALAISNTSARPVFVDIGNDFNILPNKIEEMITARTKAILPVHLYGNPSGLKEIMLIARNRSLYLIEDACQAHGASIDAKPVGGFGDTGCFSFHPSKIIGALGDGGMVLTSNKGLAHKIERLREANYNEKNIPGSSKTPAVLDPIHVPFLRVKLRHLEEIIKKRNALAGIYSRNLGGLDGIKVPYVREGCVSCYRNYTIRAKNRDGLLRYLSRSGIEAKIFYSLPLHLHNEFGYLGYSCGDFPECERAYKEIISLPISHTLSPETAELVSNRIKRFYGS